jgi:ABC-type uncharacterized transport system permease subunit
VEQLINWMYVHPWFTFFILFVLANSIGSMFNLVNNSIGSMFNLVKVEKKEK